MARAIILVLDSFGVGAADDAARYGDEGSNTYGHIAEHCMQGLADVSGLRQGPLHLPHLSALGLNHLATEATNKPLESIAPSQNPQGIYGYAQEQSLGKDTPSGHWEMAGVPVLFEWGYFQPDYPSFPQSLVDDFLRETGLPGILGNKHASGTEIIKEYGQKHIETGKVIAYTSADSVFQIAAHEKHFGLKRLYEISEIARKLVDKYNIGRVIARPFVGEPGDFTRTANRRDYATPPPEPTLLDYLQQAGKKVIAIGKISDIFAHQGISKVVKAENNMALFDATLDVLQDAPDGSLVFTNFVDFDSAFGHRRDITGYANALEAFDVRLPELKAALKEGDLVILTADHGCDPSWEGSDHTREFIPIIAYGPSVEAKNIGKRASFADIGQSVATHLNIPPLPKGQSFI